MVFGVVEEVEEVGEGTVVEGGAVEMASAEASAVHPVVMGSSADAVALIVVVGVGEAVEVGILRIKVPQYSGMLYSLGGGYRLVGEESMLIS